MQRDANNYTYRDSLHHREDPSTPLKVPKLLLNWVDKQVRKLTGKKIT